MATLMKGLSGNRAKVGVADGGGEGLMAENEASDAPVQATFEAEPAKNVEAGGASAISTVGQAVKGQAVTSGGPDMERMLRQGFVRKVYGILAIQVLVTFGLIGGFQTKSVNNMMKECVMIKCQTANPDGTGARPIECLAGCQEPGGQCLNPDVNSLDGDTKLAKDFGDDPSQCPGHMLANGRGIGGDGEGNYYIQQPTGLMTSLYWTGFATSFAALIMLVCCINSLGRRYPHNYVLLSVFTLGQGFNLATYCVMMDAQIILVAAGMTAVITLALSVFACQTKIDFTGMGSYLYAAVWSLILFGIVFNMGWAPGGARNIYLLVGVLIFSMYLVYDTQIIVGGEHKSYQFDMDDYVLAALVIYLDIINLFILLLQLLNGGRRD